MEMAQSQARSVLLVEDDKLDVDLIVNRLMACNLNIEVDFASTAEEGLRMAGKRHYDLILCDFHLPGMNGLSFLKMMEKIRANMRIILMTGYPSDELEAKVIRHGASTYLSKTVDDPTFVSVIREALSFSGSPIPMRYH